MADQLICLPVEPTAKGRPRVVRLKNGASHTFTPDKTVSAEERIRWHLREMGAKAYPPGVPLEVQIAFHIKRPKSKKKTAYPVCRPDIDQFLKLVCDALQPLVIPDDAQIVRLTGEKHYVEGDPEIRICIIEADWWKK